MYRIYNALATSLEKRFNFDARYFLRGGFWLTLGQGVTILLGILTTALFAHYLSETDYGIYRYLLGIALIFSSFSLTGLGQAILQTAAQKYYSFYQETLKKNILYSGAISFLGIIGFTYYYLNENIVLAGGCLLIAILQPIINSFQNIPALLQGNGQFKEATILNITKSAFVSLITIIALFLTGNILILLASYLGSHAIYNIFSHLWFKPKVTEATPPSILTKYLNYAKHTSFRFLILNGSFRADTIIIFTQLGAVELAVYTLAVIIPEQIKGSFKNISTLLLPKYAKHGDFHLIRNSIPLRSLQMGVVLVGITIAYILVAPYVYGLLFPKYESAILLSQLLALSFPAMVALIPMSALESQLQESDLYRINIVNSLSTVGLTLVLTITAGILGSILAKIISRYVSLIFTFYYFFKRSTKITS